MRAIVLKYLEKKDPQLYAQMTSEEQRHVDRQKPKGKAKAKTEDKKGRKK